MTPARLILALAGLLLPAVAFAQNPYRLKPGATGKVCLDCHTELEDQMALPSVHTPVRSGQCSDCHNPHASSHGQLLAADGDSICTDCHAGLIPAGSLSVHQAAIEGGCVACHDPHAAANANVLTATGSELCFSCHESMAQQLEGQEFQHSPVRQSCTTCHDPHASTASDFLLKKPTGGLCADCHDPARASFAQSHMGYPVGSSRCTSCHDPHGSNTSGILLAEVHEPITRKMCNQCHAPSSASDALALKRTGQALCRGCHSEVVNQALARDRIHWPVADASGCLTCHNPHASTEKGLLVEPTTLLCGECHAAALDQLASAATRHGPVADGDCSACHEPHAADNVFLLATADVATLCGECHDWGAHSSHPLGPEVVDQRNPNLTVDCLSCHRPHGSAHKALAHLDPGGPLCVQCHEQMSR